MVYLPRHDERGTNNLGNTKNSVAIQVIATALFEANIYLLLRYRSLHQQHIARRVDVANAYVAMT